MRRPSLYAFISLLPLPPRRRPFTRFTMTQSTPKIGTHDGTFHCDEALACHMLRHLPTYAASPIIRTRDPSALAALDVVVDVGSQYDPHALRFDHHQRGFSHTYADKGPRSRTKLSSAGLVYRHFGRDVVREVLKARGVRVHENDLPAVVGHVYDAFVEEVDAVDNGVARFDTDKPARYQLSTHLSARVGRLNADWWEKQPDQDANFAKAMQLAGGELDDCIERTARSWLPARSIVATAMAEREERKGGKRVLVLREWAPWKDHLYAIERELDAVGEVLYVVYRDMTGKSWRVQCVPVEEGSFTSRKALPEAWRGLRDEELSAACGVDGCVFVHAAGFIGGNLEFEGAMDMVVKALDME